MPATVPAAVPRHILPVLVLAQFAGTSLWFAVNAVMPDLQAVMLCPPQVQNRGRRHNGCFAARADVRGLHHIQ